MILLFLFKTHLDFNYYVFWFLFMFFYFFYLVKINNFFFNLNADIIFFNGKIKFFIIILIVPFDT